MPPHDWEVRADKLGRIVRMLRIRQRLTQVALAAKAGVSRRTVSLVERNRADELPLRVIDAIVNALGARLDVRLFWHGPELDRLLDADHAALAALLKPRLESWGWIVRVEVSYSRFGERGRIDLLAWHPLTRTLLVVEVKTDLVDIQGLLGSVDAKARLAVHVSRDIGWDVRSVVPAITFLEDRTVRNRLAQLDTLFDRYELRGRAALAWLRRPSGVPRGALWFQAIDRPNATAARRCVYGPRRHERTQSARQERIVT